MTAGGMAADKDSLRIAAMRADLPMDKRDGIEHIVIAFRENMLWRQTIACADECDPVRRQCRRHEQHPFLVAVGPAAAMQRDDDITIRALGRNNRQRLIRILTIRQINRR